MWPYCIYFGECHASFDVLWLPGDSHKRNSIQTSSFSEKHSRHGKATGRTLFGRGFALPQGQTTIPNLLRAKVIKAKTTALPPAQMTKCADIPDESERGPLLHPRDLQSEDHRIGGHTRYPSPLTEVRKEHALVSRDPQSLRTTSFPKIIYSCCIHVLM